MEISNSIVSIFEPLKKIMENKPEKLTPEKILKTQSIISEFFLSTDTITVEEALVSWNVLHDLACNTYTVTKTSESAVLAENLSGLLLWKLQHDWSKNITNELSNLSKLLENFNSEKSISKITSSGLRTSARFGPSNMYRLVGEWIEIFRNVFFNIHDKNPDNMLDTQLVESLDIFFDPLIGKKFEILYDMPFVQEGLRIVSNSVNWILPFSAIIKRTREQTLTPLTRSLYIIALVDEYFINGNNQNSKSLLTHQFKKNMQYIDEKVFIPLNKVNLSPKTSNEVRISSALAYQDPFVTTSKPGTISIQLNSNPDIFGQEQFLTFGSMFIHINALIKLLTSTDGSMDSIKLRVNENAAGIWETIQSSTTPFQVVDTLIGAGFTPIYCGILEGVVVDQFSKIKNVDLSTNEKNTLNDIQQLIGCIAIVGGLVFKLLQNYGYGLDYIKFYTSTLSELEPVYGELLNSLGLPYGGVEQTIRHCIAPKPRIRFIEATRAALVEELNIVEERIFPGGFTHSAAREALLTWFDFRSKDLWGIQIPTDNTNENVLSPVNISVNSEEELIEAATRISYPSMDDVKQQILIDPSFAPYLITVVLSDALSALANARFTTNSISNVIRVLIWARNYGTGAIANLDGYRTKLTAIIASLAIFLKSNTPTPTITHSNNIKSLMWDLHSVIVSSNSLIPNKAKMVIFERPTPKNSLFLSGLYSTAIHRRLDGLVLNTSSLAESIVFSTVAILKLMKMLKRFFSCKFLANSEQHVITIYSQVPNTPAFGTWRLTDLVDSIRSVYDEINTHRSDIRSDVTSLKGYITKSTEALQESESLTKQVEGSDFEPLFKKLLSTHTKLSRLQTALLIKSGKFLSGPEIPGLKHVSIFLKRWGSISSSYNKTTSNIVADDTILSLASNVRHIWDEIQRDRENAPPPPQFKRNLLEAAVNKILGSYSEVLDDNHSTIFLTSKANISSWGDVNMETLHKRVSIPGDIDFTYDDDSVLKETWLTQEDLMIEVDSIFNTNT
ncbi:tegument protein UL37-like protein [Phocid alphaherpesvirus 1]|uniref:Tegument protein UL37-like protein n=1 Tax=Phocid alphaherpesvirus 1 TaxID=47418 RepID=A0A482F610_9ALPH|nr:tegument protein UL37-like protein [Phocid alphaherpesvirus 1]QBN85158.1 tegument protein UL37-like protein [Phocid alphaherpesvirus 1]UNP64243.1 tegument protein UL37-like protein [Phocid alphaherpesvirus 1]